ncbi:hypothetical protein Salat_2665300 [Sesamum alatum]|uniref:Uncharacterized protein n=1 Tax=Sesamum alatum TaxID=300844 RepID=A0AAE2CAZ0_9LAMI|nr:hypothetical protein Salat_2665300 [Sesamum alatum]
MDLVSDIGSVHASRLDKIVWTPYMEHRSRRSRDDYEDTTDTQSSQIGTPPTSTYSGLSGSKCQERRRSITLQWKKCENMDKLNESLQGKIDQGGPKATADIECCIDELTKFQDLPNSIFTTALECFHSHNTRTIFLRLDDENKLRWLYSLQK